MVVATNLVVDPYGFYRWFNAPGFNTIKPRAGQQIVRNKAHGIVFRKPNAIILGNSRSEIGFDPHAAAWPPGMRVFNSGIPGGGTQTAVQFMEFALKQGDVKLAVIGIDFLDFLANPTSASPESNNTSGRSISMDLAAELDDARTAIFSTDALSDSILTVLISGTATQQALRKTALIRCTITPRSHQPKVIAPSSCSGMLRTPRII
ncbi:MAG TPA: hypothetical protein VFC39_01745 [Acidobacteriaceae bacterium]|nr:hypothetical protein [Acidobacteriaceae bacterium]